MAEEILLRGVIQRWLTRWLGGNDRASWVAIAAVSLAAAGGNLGSGNSPAISAALALVLGLGFGRVSWCRSVEASIAAHAGLNAALAIHEVLARSS